MKRGRSEGCWKGTESFPKKTQKENKEMQKSEKQQKREIL